MLQLNTKARFTVQMPPPVAEPQEATRFLGRDGASTMPPALLKQMSAEDIRSKMQCRRAKVLAEIIGSRPINCSIIMMVLAMLVGIIYTIIVVGTSVALCGSEITNFANNPWYSILTTQPGNKSTLSFASFLMQQSVLAVAAKNSSAPISNGMEGIVPWCAYCSPNQLVNLSSYFVDGFSTEIQNPGYISDLFLSLMPMLAFALSYVELFADEGMSSICVWTALLELSAALVETNYVKIDGTQGVSLLCLLGLHAGEECNPCGNLTTMELDFLYIGDDGVGVFQDQRSGTVFNSTDMGRIWPRCAKLVGTSFIDPCSLGIEYLDSDNYYTAFTSLIAERNSTITSSSISTNEHSFMTRSNLVGSSGGSNGASVLEEVLRQTAISNLTSEIDYLISSLRQSLLSGGEVFQTLGDVCSELPDTRALFIFEEGSVFSAPVDQDETVEEKIERWQTWSICWGALLYYFWRTPKCYESMVNTSNLTLVGEVQDAVIYGSLLEINRSIVELPEGTTYGDGYPAINFGTYYPNLSLYNDVSMTVFPSTMKEFTQIAEECNQVLDESLSLLDEMVAFLSQMAGCDAPARQLRASLRLDLIGWLIGILLLILQLVWLFSSAVSPHSLAMIFCSVMMIEVSDSGSFYFDYWTWSTTDFKLSVFFNTPVMPGSSIYWVSATRALTVTAFFLFHGLTMMQLGRKKESNSGKTSISRIWNEIMPPSGYVVLLAGFLYFALRVGIGLVLLGTHPGLVPFVNIVTLFRICALSETRPAPYCSSLDVDSGIAVRAFAGNFFVFFLDLTLVLYTLYLQKRALVSINSFTYSEARDRHLIFNLELLFTWLLFFSVFLCGIIYVSLADVLVGYDGYYVFTNGTVYLESISPQVTGVQSWDMGFTILVFSFVFGWTILMIPLSSRIGKLIAKHLHGHEQRVEYFTTEEEVLQTVAPQLSKGRLNATIFDERVFVTETHLLSFQLTLSAYHIGNIFTDGSGILPPHIQEVAYISEPTTDTHVWIIAEKDRILIGFRGTTSTKNAQTDLRMGFKHLSWLEHDSDRDTASHSLETSEESSSVDSPTKSPENQADEIASLERADKMLRSFTETNRHPNVHGGFLVAFHSIQNRLLSAVCKHLRQHPEVDKIITNGHSLGGALATVCGLFLATAFSPKRVVVQVSTFGSPRVGNHVFRTYFSQHVLSCWRFAKRGDPISKTPPRLIGSSTHGYTHVGVEVLLEQTGDVIIDPSMVEHTVLHSCRRGGGADHKVAAYLASLLGFALASDRSKSWQITPLWPNCKERIRAHATSISRSFPRTSASILSFVGERDAISGRDEQIAKIFQNENDMIEIHEEDSALEVTDVGPTTVSSEVTAKVKSVHNTMSTDGNYISEDSVSSRHIQLT